MLRQLSLYCINHSIKITNEKESKNPEIVYEQHITVSKKLFYLHIKHMYSSYILKIYSVSNKVDSKSLILLCLSKELTSQKGRFASF